MTSRIGVDLTLAQRVPFMRFELLMLRSMRARSASSAVWAIG